MQNFPNSAGAAGAVAKCKGNAAGDQREKHEHDRQVKRRQQNVVCGGKCREEQRTAEHQPSLVSVPDRLDACHHQIAICLAWRKKRKNANSEVKAIREHVDGNPKDREQCEETGISSPHSTGAATVAARIAPAECERGCQGWPAISPAPIAIETPERQPASEPQETDEQDRIDEEKSNQRGGDCAGRNRRGRIRRAQ